ncbi:class I SAM-dependent methyltransferase [Luteimonas sp. MJ293]|uniref:class I SAM-dependent methyltransferase n=1 Tax=Luteimonas sp. MJ146 TaxID=3129240 RepID=UPI0031BAC60E
MNQFIYRHRLAAKRMLAGAGQWLPAGGRRRLRNLAEQVAFRITPQYQGDTLPPIFHYWSSRYVLPRLRRLGVGRPEDLYLAETIKCAEMLDRPISVASFGSGACELELSLAATLRGKGIAATVECIDFNSSLIRRGEDKARLLGLSDLMRFSVADCNQYAGARQHDVIIVNQFFHHVEDLESFCAALSKALSPGGVLVTSDIVGRNGHVTWPAVDSVVQAQWRTLHPEKRFDRYFGKRTGRYVAIDHAAYSNEGIRAQDIVGRLLDTFDFSVFVTYGGAIMPFVERRIGFNFDQDDAADRAFIEGLGELDDAAIASGVYPASNMIAVLGHRGQVRNQHFDPVSPAQHVEMTRAQLALAISSSRVE